MTHVAAGDCERCQHRVIAQPVNSVSSLALSLAGAWILARSKAQSNTKGDEAILPVMSPFRGEQVVGWTAIAAGLGSVAYHGPGGVLGRYLHDASLLALLGAVIAADGEQFTSKSIPRQGDVVLWVLAFVGARPRWSMATQAVVGSVAVAAEVARMRRGPRRVRDHRKHVAEALVTGFGATNHVLGRTGGPLCRPDSVFQAHAIWHCAIAVALTLRSA